MPRSSVVTLQYVDGCPNAARVERDLRELVAGAPGVTLRRQLVASPQHAERLGFAGSPTVLINGVDPFASGVEPVGLACRVYDTPDGPRGAPTRGQLAAALGVEMR